MVSIPPQKYFAEKIGGEKVNVSIMLPPGTSPHSFEPKPAQMVELGNTNIYMAIGVEYEKTLLPRIRSMYPNLQITHTDNEIIKIPMTVHSHEHDQDPHHGHEHNNRNSGHDSKSNGRDPHVWLSPDLVMVQASSMYQAMAQASPEDKSYFQENYINFINELISLDQEIKSVFSTLRPGTKFMVFHPAWGYFARAYGLTQIPVEIEGKEAKSADIKHLIDTARHENIKVVFVSPQFSKRSAQTIADAIEGKTISINPLAENWKKNMVEVAQRFKEALTGDAH
ncbi:MAG: zinc ABC transporter substrate-binding protein [Desulfovibrionales bacterium]|nr:zinc ABC transporter substrate-binding protein [Desulfovibrionales bacterium]